MSFYKKYLKYKNKYLSIIQKGGMENVTFEIYGKTINTNVFSNFTCVITLDLMEDPVIASDGFTYEKSAITNLLGSVNPKSPHTRQALTQVLIPNYSLKGAIDEFKEVTYKRGLKKQIGKLKINAENNDLNSILELARMYKNGEGLVIQDLEVANKYYEKALQLGDKNAQVFIDEINCKINEQEYIKEKIKNHKPIITVSKETVVYLHAGMDECMRFHEHDSRRVHILPYEEQINAINEIYKKYMDTEIIHYLQNIDLWYTVDETPEAMEKNFKYLYFTCKPLYIPISFNNFDAAKNFIKEINNSLNYIYVYPIKYGHWEVYAYTKNGDEIYDFRDEHIYDLDIDRDDTTVKLYGGYFSESHRPYQPDTIHYPSVDELNKVIEIYNRFPSQDEEDFETRIRDNHNWTDGHYTPACMEDEYSSHTRPLEFTINFECTRDAINFIRDLNIELNMNEHGVITTYGDWTFCATLDRHTYGNQTDTVNDMMQYNKIMEHINENV